MQIWKNGRICSKEKGDRPSEFQKRAMGRALARVEVMEFMLIEMKNMLSDFHMATQDIENMLEITRNLAGDLRVKLEW